MRAYAIHIGLNAVDAAHYNGWHGTLAACENDARDMAAITRANLFDVTLLLTQQATSTRLLQLLADQAARMVFGDRLVLTFAGHGAQLRDLNGDEPDRLDETWALYDRMLIDDELYNALTRFRPGVRLYVVADSCHSATSIRLMGQREGRSLSETIAAKVYRLHQWTYRRALSVTPRTTLSDLRCSAILLAACKDNQVALDGEQNGLFTRTLKRVWAGGRFTGDHLSFVRRIQTEMPRYQTPSLISLGAQARQFELERPFTSSQGL